MDRISEYRKIICDFLEDFVQSDANGQLIFDFERDRYLVMHNEWRNDYRIYGCAMQLDISYGPDASRWERGPMRAISHSRAPAAPTPPKASTDNNRRRPVCKSTTLKTGGLVRGGRI